MKEFAFTDYIQKQGESSKEEVDKLAERLSEIFQVLADNGIHISAPKKGSKNE